MLLLIVQLAVAFLAVSGPEGYIRRVSFIHASRNSSWRTCSMEMGSLLSLPHTDHTSSRHRCWCSG